jgi:hypothetical protein
MTLARVVSMLVLTSFAVLAGCSGKVVGGDLISGKPDPTDPNDPNDPGDPNDPNDPTDPVCSPAPPACDVGDVSFASESACKSGGAAYCYSRGAACRKQVIWCGHLDAQCDAIPTCEAGDTTVTACPSGGPGNNGFCYPRTLCGSTILCYHQDSCTARPACDAGDKEVLEPSMCLIPGALCYKRSQCGVTITCSK